jgi:hypothetical protein
MSRGRYRFKQSDLDRAVRVAEKRGTGWGVEVLLDGTIRLSPVRPASESGQNPKEFGDRPPMVF